LALAPRLAWRFTRATITKQARPATAPEERPGGWKPTSYVDKMINAIIAGSWSSTWFGIRAPWMVERRFLPAHGTATALWQYLETSRRPWGRAAELLRRCIYMGLCKHDVAIMVDVLSACPRTALKLCVDPSSSRYERRRRIADGETGHRRRS
jgi:hypothetical protein